MSAADVPHGGHVPDAGDRRLMDRLRGSLPLSERPFADLGAELGMSEEVVIDRLHRLLAQGVLTHFGPVFQADQKPQTGFDRAMMAATLSGLPLLPRPYEALGAMLGVSAVRVRERLAAMCRDGLILRIGAEP